MQQPWPACRSAKGGLYIWSQSTPNSIILERVSCVSSTERLFTCAEPRCYFASPSVFIMMALFCLLVGGEVSNTLRHHPVSFCPNVVSVFLFINSQYLVTAHPCPTSFFSHSAFYREELQRYLIVRLRTPVRSPVATSSRQNVGCLRVFLYIYCEECYLNRTCQSQWNDLQPLATIVFFFLPNMGQFLFEKNEKCQQRHRLCPFCTLACFLLFFFFSSAPKTTQNCHELTVKPVFLRCLFKERYFLMWFQRDLLMDINIKMHAGSVENFIKKVEFLSFFHFIPKSFRKEIK